MYKLKIIPHQKGIHIYKIIIKNRFEIIEMSPSKKKNERFILTKKK